MASQETRQVPEWKKYMVSEVKKILKEYKIVGILSLKNLPSAQLQSIRGQIRNNAKILTAKKSVIKHALESTKLKDLEKYLSDIPALILTNVGAFQLAKLIDEKKVPAYAKIGQICPRDIVVEAGMTQFMAGPMISDFAGVGIKTKVTEGKIEIIKDTTICKEGGVIDEKLANIMKKIGIKASEVGLTIVAVYDNKEIFEGKELSIDVDEYLEKIGLAHTQAFNLSIESGILLKENVELMLNKASTEAYNLGIEAAIPADEVIERLLSVGTSQAKSLANEIKSKYELKEGK